MKELPCGAGMRGCIRHGVSGLLLNSRERNGSAVRFEGAKRHWEVFIEVRCGRFLVAVRHNTSQFLGPILRKIHGYLRYECEMLSLHSYTCINLRVYF
jgi:hypothetical protein